MANFNRKDSFNDNRQINPNDTFNSLFGNCDNIDNFREATKNPLYEILQEKYKAVFQEGYKHHLQAGEVQILIHAFSNGKSLHDIEYRRLDDLKMFVKHNGNKMLSYINPDLHGFLLGTKYYSKDPYELPKINRLSRVMQIIKRLSKKKQTGKLKKFAEILSKL